MIVWVVGGVFFFKDLSPPPTKDYKCDFIYSQENLHHPFIHNNVLCFKFSYAFMLKTNIRKKTSAMFLYCVYHSILYYTCCEKFGKVRKISIQRWWKILSCFLSFLMINCQEGLSCDESLQGIPIVTLDKKRKKKENLLQGALLLCFFKTVSI